MAIRDWLARLGTKASIVGLSAAEMPDKPLERDFDDASLLSTYRDDAWPYILANKIGEQASKAPLVVGRNKGTPDKDDFAPSGPQHPIQRLLDNPNTLMDGGEFIHTLMLYMEIVGHAPIEIGLNRGKTAQELYLHNPGPWRIVPNQNATIRGYLYKVDTGDVRWGPERMTYLRWPNPNSRWYGQGRIAAVRQEVMAEEYAAIRDKKFEKQYGVPPGILTSEQPIGDTTAQELQKRWEKAVGGYTNAGRIAVLGSKTTYQAVALSHRDSEWLAQRGWRVETLAAAFGVPMPMIRMEGATFSNSKEARAEFWEGTLITRLDRIARMLTIRLLPLLTTEQGLELRFDYTKVEALSENDLEAAKTAGEWAKTGVVTVDEVRARLGLEAHPNAEIGSMTLQPSTITAKSDEDITDPPEPVLAPAAGAKPPAARPGPKAMKVKPDREIVLAPVRDTYRKDLAAYFAAQERKLIPVIGKTGAHDAQRGELKADDDLIERVIEILSSKSFRERLRRISEGPLNQSLTSGAVAAAQELAIEVSFAIDASPAAQELIGAHLERLAKGVETTTITDVTAKLRTALAEQWTNEQIRDGLSQLFKGYEDWRLDLISRTETTVAYNVGTIGQYRDAGVQMVKVIDGDGDAECAAANGSLWTLEEAEGNPLAHPNCTRTWIPDTSGFKAQDTTAALIGLLAKRMEPQPVNVTVNQDRTPPQTRTVILYDEAGDFIGYREELDA